MIFFAKIEAFSNEGVKEKSRIYQKLVCEFKSRKNKIDFFLKVNNSVPS